MVIVRVRVGCRSDVSADRPVVADSADALVGYTRRADDDARLLLSPTVDACQRCSTSLREVKLHFLLILLLSLLHSQIS